MFNEIHSDLFSPKGNNMRRICSSNFNLDKIQNFGKNKADLSDEERDFLVRFAQDQIKKLYNSGFESDIDRKNEILQGRFKNALKCPKCGNLRLNKNGKTNGRQRYMCKECRTTFDERSFSPLSNTKLSLDKWLKYCRFMLEGGTIRYCAEEVGVSVPTSFFMRHRILDVMNLCLKDEVLDGIVEELLIIQ
ncbi:MAG: transposase [Intestinibacter sp.]